MSVILGITALVFGAFLGMNAFVVCYAVGFLYGYAVVLDVPTSYADWRVIVDDVLWDTFVDYYYR